MSTEIDDVDKLHEEIYGKPDQAPVTPYVDDDDPPADGDGDGTLPPAAPVVPPVDDFKHKYDVLQGKYNTEIGRMNTMLSAVMTEKEALKAKLETAPVAPVNVFSDNLDIDDEDDIEFLKAQYPEVFKGIEALAKKKAAEILGPAVDGIAKATSTAAAIESDRYFRELDGKVKNWRVVNVDPAFENWLDTPDRYTGIDKRSLIRDAFSKRDSARTIAFFEDFAKLSGSAPPNPSPNPSQDPPDPAQSHLHADTDIYPSNAGSPAPSTREKGIVLRSDIDRFYKDRAQGRFAGTEDEAARVEARFFRAVKEGKVR